MIPLLLAGAAVDAGVVEPGDPAGVALGAGVFAESPAPLTLLAVPDAAEAAEATEAPPEVSEAPEPSWDGSADAASVTTPATGWVTTEIGPDKPVPVVPGWSVVCAAAGRAKMMARRNTAASPPQA
jgi:hypothetical protein